MTTVMLTISKSLNGVCYSFSFERVIFLNGAVCERARVSIQKWKSWHAERDSENNQNVAQVNQSSDPSSFI